MTASGRLQSIPLIVSQTLLKSITIVKRSGPDLGLKKVSVHH